MEAPKPRIRPPRQVGVPVLEVGAYTEITDIIAPASAAYGDLVTIEARVKNLYSTYIYISTTGKFDNNIFYLDPEYYSVGAGEIYPFSGSFSMPNHDVRVYVWTYYWTGEEWYLDDEGYVDIALTVLPEEYKGTLTRQELEHDGTHTAIPAYNIPQGERGLVHVWGRNDMSTTQRLGISWEVYDPDGRIVDEHSEWEAWPYTSAGDDHHFIGGRFPLDKPGTYIISVSLSMNPDNPKIVDTYYGTLCSVLEEAPPIEYAGTITKKELEYNGSRKSVPASDVPLGTRGLVHIWGRNDTSVTQDMKMLWVIVNPDGDIVEEYSDWSYGHGPGDDHEFIGGRFDLDKEGTYAIAVSLLMNPDNPVIVDEYSGNLCTVVAAPPPPEEEFANLSVTYKPL